MSSLLLQLILTSGRIHFLVPQSDPVIPPGAPPILSFRYFEGQAKHRFGNFDLVVDDAGH